MKNKDYFKWIDRAISGEFDTENLIDNYDAELVDRMLNGMYDIRTPIQKLIEDNVTNGLGCTPIRANYKILIDGVDLATHFANMDLITGKMKDLGR